MISRKTCGSAALGKGPGLAATSARDEIALARRDVDRPLAAALLQLAHALHTARTPIQLREDLGVDCIDLAAQGGELVCDLGGRDLDLCARARRRLLSGLVLCPTAVAAA